MFSGQTYRRGLGGWNATYIIFYVKISCTVWSYWQYNVTQCQVPLWSLLKTSSKLTTSVHFVMLQEKNPNQWISEKFSGRAKKNVLIKFHHHHHNECHCRPPPHHYFVSHYSEKMWKKAAWISFHILFTTFSSTSRILGRLFNSPSSSLVSTKTGL